MDRKWDRFLHLGPNRISNLCFGSIFKIKGGVIQCCYRGGAASKTNDTSCIVQAANFHLCRLGTFVVSHRCHPYYWSKWHKNHPTKDDLFLWARRVGVEGRALCRKWQNKVLFWNILRNYWLKKTSVSMQFQFNLS